MRGQPFGIIERPKGVELMTMPGGRLGPQVWLARRIAQVIGLKSLVLTGKREGDPLSGEAWGTGGDHLGPRELCLRWYFERRRRTNDRMVVPCMVYAIGSDALNLNFEWAIPVVNVDSATQRVRFAEGLGNRVIDMLVHDQWLKTPAEQEVYDADDSYVHDEDISTAAIERAAEEMSDDDA